MSGIDFRYRPHQRLVLRWLRASLLQGIVKLGVHEQPMSVFDMNGQSVVNNNMAIIYLQVMAACMAIVKR